jgi:hypothetical protein
MGRMKIIRGRRAGKEWEDQEVGRKDFVLDTMELAKH